MSTQICMDFDAPPMARNEYTPKGANRAATRFEGRGPQGPDATDREARGKVMALEGSDSPTSRGTDGALAIGAAPAFIPMARRSDPATSHAAAASAKQLQGEHHRIIVAALEQHGPCGKDRLAALTSLTGVQICRRLGELQRIGKAAPTGRTVASTAGRAEREWGAIG